MILCSRTLNAQSWICHSRCRLAEVDFFLLSVKQMGSDSEAKLFRFSVWDHGRFPNFTDVLFQPGEFDF